jgi:aerobic carbon-monoxide dehydrogenase large subunit
VADETDGAIPGPPRLAGVRVPRIADRKFLTGSGRYIDDLALPGTLHVAFVRSPHAHARVLAIDTEHARTLPGVVTVLTGRDLGSELKPLRAEARVDWPLATEKVRHVGEPVAAVVAVDRYVAADAAEAVTVDYEALPAVVDAEAAAQDPNNLLFQTSFEGGDVAGAFAEAGVVVVEDVFRHPRVTGIPLETRGCLAAYDRGTDQLTLWSSTQWPHVVRTWVADCLGVPESRMRVIAPDVGGGFGIKCHVFVEEVIIASLARRLARPVKWIETRRENVTASVQAREQTVHASLAVARDGRIRGLRARIYVNVGAYPVFPWGASVEPGGTARMLPGPYRVRNYACEAYGVATNRTPTGTYRGVSYAVCVFVMESLIDQAGRVLDMDPAELRRRNLIRSEEFPYTSVTGMVYDPGSYVQSLEQVLTVLDYPALRRKQHALRAQGRYLGIGLACYCEPTGMGSRGLAQRGVTQVAGYDAARVRIDASGAVTVAAGATTQGQGLDTALAQLVADTLGVGLDDVTVVSGDTALAPYGMGAFASRGAVVGGGAALGAATKVRQKVLRIAAHRLETAVEDLVLADGRVFVRGLPSSALTLQQIARLASFTPGSLTVDMDPGLEATHYCDPTEITYSNATHGVVVEVDGETGRTTLLTYVVVEDCGRMINPEIVDGQVHGGVAQGVGAALYEQLVYDERGQPLTGNLIEYYVPTAAELPAFAVEHLVTPSPWSATGAKGMGESGTIGATAATARAIADALGVRGNVLPLTPQRVLAEARGAQP